jgi:hypothetical protein
VASLNGERELLETAVSYALASAALGTPQLLRGPTPCRGWDLETLLDHLSDSIGVLHEAITASAVSASAVSGPAGRRVAVGDRAVSASMVALTGAIEITVHGWDISVACGTSRPVPPGLAALLVPIAPLLITPGTRAGLFADPVRLPGPASPGDQLVAFLGRQPRPLTASGSAGA